MSDENNHDVNNKYPHLRPDQVANAEKSAIRLAHVSAVKKLKGDSKWSITEELLQEIQANHAVSNPGAMPTWKIFHSELTAEVKKRYADDPELLEVVLGSVPNIQSLQKWPKREGWNEAVWSKIKVEGLFSTNKRAAMIEALWKRGVEKDSAAAKMWLTMSGDYTERPPEEKNAAMNQYREINEIIHSKKKG